MLKFFPVLAALLIGLFSPAAAQDGGFYTPLQETHPTVQPESSPNADSAAFAADFPLEKLRDGYDWELLKRMHTAPGLPLRAHESSSGSMNSGLLRTNKENVIPGVVPGCFYIYPNPVSDLTFIEHCGSYPLQLEIWGTDGIFRGVITVDSPGRQVSLGHLRPGTYLLVAGYPYISQPVNIVR